MIAIILLILSMLTSCSMSGEVKSDVYLVSVALDYDGMSVSTLHGAVNDQSAVISQISHLASQSGRNFYSYQITQKGDSCYVKYETGPMLGDRTEIIRYIDPVSIKSEAVSILRNLQSRENDLVIFFYGGHGLSSKGTQEHGALVLGDLRSAGASADGDRQLIYILEDLRYDLAQVSGNKVMILDSCFSGTGNRDDGTPDAGDIAAAFSLLFSSERIKNDLIWEISASTAERPSYEKSETDDMKAHGRFTVELLKYLGYSFYPDQTEGPGLPGTGVLTVYDAWKYTHHALSKSTQSPTTGKSDRDLVMFILPGTSRF
ncbi:MAG: hypothetical protein ACI4NM_11720 [Bullifex sp.]